MLREITIRNYKIFKCIHRIALAVSEQAPVTIISTITARGKTTLIEAIYWCLYDETFGNGDNLLNLERQREMRP